MTRTNKAADISQSIGTATRHFLSGRVLEAETLCREILTEAPENPDALHLQGAIANAAGDYSTAIKMIRQAIRVKEDEPFYHSNLGLALQNGGMLDDAVAEYKCALALKPDMAAAHVNIGNILKTQGRFEEAETQYRRAIAADPALELAHYNLGGVLQAQQKTDEAIVAYTQAIVLNPGFAAARSNLGALLKEQGKLDDAIAQYRQAISIDPRLSEAYNNLGVALNEQKKTAEAITQFEQAVIPAPDNADILAQLVHRLQHACLWDKSAAPEKKLLEMVRAGRGGIPPFFVLNTPSTPAEQLACARGFGRKFAVPPEAMFRHAPKKNGSRIHIGYLSADFHQHATAFLMAELLERHDRARFEVTAYSYGPDDNSDMRRRLVQAFEHFVDIRAMPHAAAAQKIYDDGIDILIDLKGCTEHSRLQIPAYRPAPVQVNYIGYPGTTGVDFIDYIIADPFVLPLDQQPFYAEKIIHLPDCYQPNDTRRQIAATTPTRSACGLPEQGFVFCCFNQSYKIKPEIFDIWMRLLQATPRSVLWLLESNALAKDNLRTEAIRRGVDPARLVFAPHMPLPDHLARHRLADLFLDTLPINAHTTASDALWAGLPVLTCAGATFAGRVAGSLLKAADLSELITYSLQDYEALALQLAQNPAQLSALRQKLERTRLQVPLFDIERLTRNLERSYQSMRDIWQAGDINRSAGAYYDLGLALNEQSQADEAIEAYQKAISLKPDMAEAYSNLGVIFDEQKKPDKAAEMYRQAISVKPDYVVARFNLANLLREQGNLAEAIAEYAEAIKRKPDFAEAYINMGATLMKIGRVNEAVFLYDQALVHQPDNSERLAELVHYIYQACAWDKMGGHESRLLEMVRQKRSGISPFGLMGTAATAEDQLICAQSFSRGIEQSGQALFTHSPQKSTAQKTDGRIRIGYLSSDFYNHATAHLMAELFERHNRSRFCITAYSYGQDDGSAVRKRLVKAFDSFIDVQDLSDNQAAQKIYDGGIDILIDLKGGYTTDARIGIPACRPAPLQVNYVGFPGTMGVNFIDYIIADRFIIPEDQEKFYSEKVVCLPDSYQPNDTHRQIADASPTRDACNLPEQGFVFCGFNATYKITPRVFDIWMRLLHKVPGSVLWLLESNKSVKENLEQQTERRGISPERIIFAPRVLLSDHLARHQLADLFLDTLPVNAHTTTSDALWAGLPVLTCAGSTFSGRVAGSLLKAANLPELITYSLEEYEALALQLAQNPAQLATLRQKLQQTRLQVPLFDIERYTKNIEKSYQTMWDIWQAGDAPKAFTVS